MRKGILLCALLLAGLPGVFGQSDREKCAPTLRLQLRSTEKMLIQLVITDLEDFRKKTSAWSGELEWVAAYPPANIAVVRCSYDFLLQQILPLPEVRFADRGAEQAQVELPVPGHNLSANRIGALHARYPDWNGAGRTVSIKEFLFDTLDVDLRGRVGPALSGAKKVDPHAAVMATLIGGAANSGRAGQGVAWAARLTPADFAGLLPDADSMYSQWDISVQNHSYGLGIENYYGAGALAYDQSVWLRPNLLHVFSAGNLGDSSAQTGVFAGLKGFANLSGNFKMAKNVVLTGAIDSFGQLLPFSSRGPAYDGRIKPDLVAFGQDGSSGAAALVSGTAAVLQQAYASQHHDSLPPAALVRAWLLQGADDLGAPGPDFFTGFGSLNALTSARVLDAGHYLMAEMTGQDSFFVDVAVPAGSRRFKITLAWDDPPAQAGAAVALVHDLDLEVLAPNGKRFQPWVLRPVPHPDSLRLPAAPGQDSLNTVEQIGLPNPAPGIYRVIVKARKVSAGGQKFALAYHSYPADTFEWDMPARTDALVAGQSTVLQWSQALQDSTGRLEFRQVGLSSWELIDTAVALAPAYYRWTPPDTAALLQLRLKADGRHFLSDTFAVGPELHLRTGFFCPDSTLVFWNAAGSGWMYQLWGLGDRYLEPLLVSSDTFAVVPRATFPQTRWAVSPVLAMGWTGLRSGAVDISQQGLDCYLRNFLAEKLTSRTALLRLELGTTYGLEQIIIEKWEPASGFLPLTKWAPPFSGLRFEAEDPNPVPGLNRYRASLVLGANAGRYQSDTLDLFFSKPEGGIWVFPNPVDGNRQVQIVLPELPEAAVFVIFDMLGRQLLAMQPESELLTIELPALPPGCYPCALMQNGRRLCTGKILVGRP